MPTNKQTDTSQTSKQTQDSSSTSTNNSSWQNNYDPASLAAYHSILPQWQSAVSGWISSPFNNPWFNASAAMQRSQIGQQGATTQSAILNNLSQNGLAGSAAGQAMLQRQGRAVAGQQASGYNNLLLNTQGLQMQALGMAGQFSPLVTGGSQNQTQTATQHGQMTGSQNSSTVEKTSGVGTWLPQLAGAALGFASGGISGGGGLLSNFMGSSPKTGQQYLPGSTGYNPYNPFQSGSPFPSLGPTMGPFSGELPTSGGSFSPLLRY